MGFDNNNSNNSSQALGVYAVSPANTNNFKRRPFPYDSGPQYVIGDYWVYQDYINPPELWILFNKVAGVSEWIQLYPAGSTGIVEITTDSGDVSPVSGVINVNGGLNINTAAVAHNSDNLVINLNNDVIISGYYETTGGNLRLPETASSLVGTITIGVDGGGNPLPFVSGYGDTVDFSNTFIGTNSGNFSMTVNTATGNTGIGANTLNALTTGEFNTALGSAAGLLLTTGSINVLLGAAAGDHYTTSESSNILINNLGVIGESNTLRIGASTGAGSGQLNRAFISGISDYTAAGEVGVVVINTATGDGGTLDQVGIVPLDIAGYVLTSTGINTPPVFLPNGGGGGGNGGIIFTPFTDTNPMGSTWTKNAKTQFITVYMWGGGGGGASGRSVGTNPNGGAGGSGGCGGSYCEFSFPARNIGATATVIVGSGGSGGAASAGFSNIGTAGGPSSFGIINPPIGGTYGSQGDSQGNQSAGTWGDHTMIKIDQGNTLVQGRIGGSGGRGGHQVNSLSWVLGAPAEDTGFSVNPVNAQVVLASQNASGGGGGGVGFSTATRAGGTGGNLTDFSGNYIVAGGAIGTETGTLNGGNGNDSLTLLGVPTFDGLPMCGGTGGGGGGAQFAGGSAGKGGNGGFPGGGGGGGGGSYTGTMSGAGGDGNQGLVLVVEFFG